MATETEMSVECDRGEHERCAQEGCPCAHHLDTRLPGLWKCPLCDEKTYFPFFHVASEHKGDADEIVRMTGYLKGRQ